ncbi:MAG: histidinol dehydrogenase [Candidatus Abyssubacteria bacterium]
MLRIIDTRRISTAQLDEILFPRRAEEELSRIEASVSAILKSVRLHGDEAVARFTLEFDKVSLMPHEFEVSRKDVLEARGRISADSLKVLRKAHGKIAAFHRKHLRKSWTEGDRKTAVLGQRITPIARVGVYCPGGRALYPSSVLMNIIPAKVAGCREIVMVSPPSAKGSIHPALLVAADIAGATRIFRIGGAQAIAALAYGTRHIPKVDKIVGPGNIFVTMAKRLVRGQVAIDMEAGPSEIMIIADANTDPRLAAADLLSQAEHDEMAASLLVATSRRFVRRVIDEIERQIDALERRETIHASLQRNGLAFIVRNLAEAVALVNRRAPEHLELLVQNPRKIMSKIRNAGVIFLGNQTPNAVGDYFAGPNHVLPTGGQARFASPLSAEDFRKTTSVVGYSESRLRSEAKHIIALAELEGLTAHAHAVRVRLQ